MSYIGIVLHNIDILCNIWFILIVIAAFTDKHRAEFNKLEDEVKNFIRVTFILSVLGMLLIPNKEQLIKFFG